ncbi:hypothetical protein N7495_003399 [Penicillium taxi]|uniref:uncharacterized protein n=1 Tax=Penicillium taxi TaxID=168475 RepID=UPI002544E3D2|nr:uncharacterized protein N7495_003399 [Penicillium taxi]KAJ5902871.1 hypothetical protein N7495_003399 [Penicillium taxi]
MSEKKQEDDYISGPVLEGDSNARDEVFGEINGEGPNYRSVGWKGTAVLMMKTQCGLGVLSIPSAFDAIGIVPGVICLCAIAAITTWSDYIIGVFKLRHREVYGIDDVGGMLLGRTGKAILGAAFVLWWTFCAGSGMLGLSIGLNAVSDHITCTAVWVAVSFVCAAILSSIQTLGRISWLAWVGLFCILTAIMSVTIAVGVQDRPAGAPQTGVWKSDYEIVKSPSFSEAATGLSTMVFAYAGTPAFFSIVSEMREPRHYGRALVLCQTTVTLFYLVVGIVVYYYCGSYVSSPALGSGGRVMKKVAYGFGIPGLLVSTMLFVHLSAKYIFIRAMGNSRHLGANTITHWVVWLSCTIGVSLVAYIIASAIPVFSDLVSLVGALFGTPLCFQPMAGMWLYDNWSQKRSARWMLMVAWCGFIIIAGTFLMIGGTYGSIVSIMDDYKKNGGHLLGPVPITPAPKILRDIKSS